eukprot:TRINITY_DN1883_c12_g1_i2.p1 TRINITY_DN1883_c12_g1~~TRINITY_DN1883_c12_g1_i2.p1  ORF type:complete len:834 (-),score=304.11 TRINITY_DN1883_c12_g1_i2:16-2517(-)
MEESSKNIISQREEIESLLALYPEIQTLTNGEYQMAIERPDHTPLIFGWMYPPTYPETTPPVFHLSASWLHGGERDEIHSMFQSLWESSTSKLILFECLEWITQYVSNLGSRQPTQPKEQPNQEQKKPARTSKDTQKQMKILETAFPTMDVSIIWTTFKSNHYDVEKTVEILVSTSGRSIKPDVLGRLKAISNKAKRAADGSANAQPQSPSKSEDTEGTKDSLRTSEDVFYRILWDDRYNKEDFVICYLDRFDGIKEASFTSWESKDVTAEIFIPWHRVQYIKCRDEIVWDRRTREDYIFGPIKKGFFDPNAPARSTPAPKVQVEKTSHVSFPKKEIRPKISNNKTVQSAVVIIPDPSQWEPIEKIRRNSDKSYQRWMPHINLLYPFLPGGELRSASLKIHKAVAEISPFKISLSQFGYFTHEGVNATVWLNPEAENNAIHNLQNVLQHEFPELDDLSKKSAEGYNPHLTVSQVPRDQAPAYVKKYQTNWSQLEFQVENVYVIHRTEDKPFRIMYRIPLKSQGNLPRGDFEYVSEVDQFPRNFTNQKTHSDLIPFFKFQVENSTWQAVPAQEEEVKLENLRIVTFNVLFDTYMADQIHSAERYPRLLEILRKTRGDVICLQEMTLTLLVLILKTEWIQLEYCVSDISGSTLQPYGIVVLTKIPAKKLIQVVDKSKTFMFPEFLISGYGSLLLAAVHLTSDRGENPQSKRKQQLLSIFRRGISHQHCIIAGDFNFGDSEEDAAMEWGTYRDAWRETHPGSPGYTYDPIANSIAKVTSSKGIPRRLDRVMISSQKIKVASMEIIGNEAFQIETPEGTQNIFASDHFGLQCDVVFQ